MNKPKFTAETVKRIKGIYGKAVKVNDYNVRVDKIVTLRIALIQELGWCVVKDYSNKPYPVIDHIMTRIVNK